MKATKQATELILLIWALCAALPARVYAQISAETIASVCEPDEMPAALRQHPVQSVPELLQYGPIQRKSQRGNRKTASRSATSRHRLYLPPTLDYVPIDSSVCARLDSAFLTFPKGTRGIMPSFTKLSHILQGRNERLNIIHIGDSHIQADIISGRIRHNLTEMGEGCNADRGILFPFQAIGTNAPADYSITHTGRWTKTWNLEQNPVYPIGISGAVATTTDADASLTIDVRQPKWSFSALRILGSSPSGNRIPVVHIDGLDFLATTDDQPGYVIELPDEVTSCSITFSGTGTFELRGIIPMSPYPGITYSAVGINGASCLSWLRCEKFEEELALLQPDIAVLALGTNDANARVIDIENFKTNYRRLIDKILSVNPRCFIIFTTNPDCYIGSARIWCPTTLQTQRAFYELAKEYGAAVFDIFAVQGGAHSTERWVAAGLQQPDHVHFSGRGYSLLGDLFFNAFLRSYKEASK